MSFSQLMALLFGALLGPVAELLPGTAAQAGIVGALAVFGGGIVMAASGLLLGTLAASGEGLTRGLEEAFGIFFGKVVLLIYMAWCQVLLTLRLRLSAQRLLGSGEGEGAVWFFLLALGGMALWMAHGHLGAVGRTAQLFFTALGVTGGVVLLLALFQVREENLLTTWTWNAAGAEELLRPGLSAMGYGLFSAFLLQREKGRRFFRPWLGWTAGGCLILAVAQVIMIGRYGPQLTSRLHSPFFQLAKSVGLEGAFQRVESIVAAIWVFSDLLLLTGILWCMRRIGRALCPTIPTPTLVTVSALGAMVTALALFRENLSPRALEAALLPAGSLLLSLGIPGLAILIRVRRSA